MAKEETIKIKKGTLIIGIIVLIAIIAALATVYYLNTKSKDVKTTEIGSIETIELDIIAITTTKCPICMDMKQAIDEIKSVDFVNVRQSSIIDASSREAKELITEYEINKIPALILQGDTDKLPLRGVKKIDIGVLVEDIPPPYINLEEQRVVGLVNITYLTDDSCVECYDVEDHKQVLELAFGIYLAEEETIDISSNKGKEIIEKYKITKVPTIILTPEAKEYPTVQMIWDQIGTVEKDGMHIFRNFETTTDLVYKDLETNQLVNTSQLSEE